MQSILITGAAGFIGFHLTKKLCNLGFNVVGIDNLNDYYDVKLKAFQATRSSRESKLQVSSDRPD